MKEVMDATFVEEVMNSEQPVLVDFWAPWCGPCKMVTPVMEELDQQYDGKIKVVKVNVDENPEISEALRITSIPTIVLFKEGQPKDAVVGFRPKNDFEKMIDKHL
ncbi:thioredoxin [Alkalibacter mobilis]|uniref:thioredoxin n=1 Tax=Alkalibacter mobilis TaxID=2787712 RepID=UPI00189F1BB4|nr:thioredoxin [Alkalibacter mobilis]MBF7096359.1 thioredoxin [Alkalibacter mobilis]